MCIRDSRRAGKDEALKAFEIDRVGRHRGVECARAARRLTHRAGVAGGAVEEDTIDSLGVALGNADRQVFARLVENCLLYTSDAADERSSVDLGGRRII